jgi:xylose isomerase
VHLNDNHRDWDDDLIPGTVHVPEFLELAYWLVRSGYKGWLTLDIFPYREEKIPAAVESFEWIRHVLSLVQERGIDAITEVVRRGEGTDSVRMVREMLGGRTRAAAGAQAGRGR